MKSLSELCVDAVVDRKRQGSSVWGTGRVLKGAFVVSYAPPLGPWMSALLSICGRSMQAINQSVIATTIGGKRDKSSLRALFGRLEAVLQERAQGLRVSGQWKLECPPPMTRD